jgi:hypothetical protein
VLRLAFVFDRTGQLGLRLLLWSEVKKSGKTFIAACLGIWWAATRTNTEVLVVANDLDQAQGRVFKTMVALCRLNGLERAKYVKVKATELEFISGTTVTAIASEYAGAAGSRHSLVIFDELWAFGTERAVRLVEELTPPPTEENAWQLVVTYAGFTGESKLLETLYQRGLTGERIDRELEVYRADDLLMFWSHQPRQPWQTPEYYASQRRSLRPNTYARIHENRWVSSESAFIPAEMWDACVVHTLSPMLTDDGRAIWGGLDIAGANQHATAKKNDGVGFAAVTWERDGRLRLVAHRIWKAPVDLAAVERYLVEFDERFDLRGVLVDPFQAARSQAILRDAGVRIAELPQTSGNTTRMGETLYDLLKGKTLRLYADPELREQALATVAVESTRGMRIAKATASRKIDGISALAMACVAAVEAGPDSSMPLMVIGGDTYRDWEASQEPDVIDIESEDARGSWPEEDDEPDDYVEEDDVDADEETHPDEPGGSGWSAISKARQWASGMVTAFREQRAEAAEARRRRAEQTRADAVAAKAQRRDQRRREVERLEQQMREDAVARRDRERRQADARFIEKQTKSGAGFFPSDWL